MKEYTNKYFQIISSNIVALTEEQKSELKQKYLQIIYGVKKQYKTHEVNTINKLLEVNKEYYQYSNAYLD